MEVTLLYSSSAAVTAAASAAAAAAALRKPLFFPPLFPGHVVCLSVRPSVRRAIVGEGEFQLRRMMELEAVNCQSGLVHTFK